MFYNQSGVVLNGLERCHKRGGSICLAVKGSKRCFSVYQGDLAPTLIAFNARCVIEKKGSSRTIPLTELFTGNGISPFAIGTDELLTKVIISAPEGSYSSSYRKLRLRGSIDYPLASAAACISVSDDREVTTCRVVIGAAGAAPKVIDEVSAAIERKRPTETYFDAIGQMAQEQTEGADNLQMPGAYRRKMVSVLAKRAVKAALDETKGGM
jgi:4-hydroxybenzoyl-CoA reductase subunit beta